MSDLKYQIQLYVNCSCELCWFYWCIDGHKTPIFQEKFVFTLIEGLREINVAVWNSNTLTVDDFIGSGK